MSACLLEQAVRYGGGTKHEPHPQLDRWVADDRIAGLGRTTAVPPSA